MFLLRLAAVQSSSFQEWLQWPSNHWHSLNHTHTLTECCKGDDASQWRKPKFDPPPRSNPISDCHKSWQRWLRRGPLHMCKSSSRSAQGFRFRACVTLRTKSVYSAVFSVFFWGGSCNSLQPRPLNRFWCKISQNTRFRARMCLFGVAIIKCNI